MEKIKHQFGRPYDNPHLVCLHVFFNVGFLSKCTATDNTLKGLLSGVRPDVLLEIKVLTEGLITVLTGEFFLGGHILQQAGRCYPRSPHQLRRGLVSSLFEHARVYIHYSYNTSGCLLALSYLHLL